MFVLVVVDYVVLVLADYVHSAEHIKCVIYASLHVFEVHFLANLAEIFVHVEYFVCNLSTGDHGPFADLLEDRLAQEDKLLVLLVFLIIRILLATTRRLLLLSFSR